MVGYTMWRRFGTLPSIVQKLTQGELLVILAYMELEAGK